MEYKAQNFERLLGTAGFSDENLKNHFGLYEGYVKNTNKLIELRQTLDVASPEYAEVTRRFGWEWDGMRLHEYYFDGMKKDAEKIDTSTDLFKKINAEFGSFEEWEKDFRGTGAMRGIGWAILYYDKQADRMRNVWINEHDTGHLAGAQPVVIMDVFEHAFMIDYKMDRKSYIDAFMNAIDWSKSEERLK